MPPEGAWLVVGLGNPGHEYAGTRHNVGFRVTAALAAAGGAFRGPDRGARWAAADLEGAPVVLLQPQDSMNRSGPPVLAWLQALGLPQGRLLVVHDDLDLDVGRVKVAMGGGDGGHRGLRSIGEALGSTEFVRVRVGVGRPARSEATAHVLAPPAGCEAEALGSAEARAAEAVAAVIAAGPVAAMNRFNPWPPGARTPGPGPGPTTPRP